MIKIVKFPSTSKSLCEVIEMLSMCSFQIVVNWQFNKGELNVTIVCQEEIESFIASWLSVNCFLYHYEDVAYDETVNMNKQYNWIPKASSDVNSLDETNLLLLLIGLKKSSVGIFTIRLESNGNIVRVAVSYRGATVPSGELISALGQRYCVKPGYITCFFDYKMNRDRLLLTLPYVTKTSTALIQGFGNKMQAKMKTDLNKNTDVVIGTVLNDPLHQILCLTLENFRSFAKLSALRRNFKKNEEHIQYYYKCIAGRNGLVFMRGLSEAGLFRRQEFLERKHRSCDQKSFGRYQTDASGVFCRLQQPLQCSSR